MIKLLVPPHNQGGVYDFSCKLQTAIGDDLASLVHISKSNVYDFDIGKDDTIVLQFSGYGFARRGAPMWLLRALEDRRQDIKRLGIYFHELYAFGPPWSSSFWLSALQRNIASELVELSDFWMTNREGSAQWLRRYASKKPSAVLPVFSNVGESFIPTKKRLPRIVVFGSPGLRQKIYKNAGVKLLAWAKHRSLEVHDVGAPILNKKLTELMDANGVIQHGLVDEQAVKKLLKQAMFGVLSYPVHVIAKSGVFAAYCANGICPILLSDKYESTDGLNSNIHYLPGIPSNTDNLLLAPNIAAMAWSWYQGHSLAIHANKLCEFAELDESQGKTRK